MTSAEDLLDLRLYSRQNIYLASDEWASVVVDAVVSRKSGQRAYCNQLGSAQFDIAAGLILNTVVYRADNGGLVLQRLDVPLNSTGIEGQFPLADFPPRLEPYELVIKFTALNCGITYQSSTFIYRLPERTDGGSVVRVDNRLGGISVYTGAKDREYGWKPLFPFSFYVDWNNWLAKDETRLQTFASQGYNIIHPVPRPGSTPWGDGGFAQFDKFLDQAERLGLHVMYDMRWSYRNESLVRTQVERYSKRKSILTWYTADEPDGHGDPLTATTTAYDLIKSIDPYRPISLVLNCQDYFYKEYSAGADIVLSNPYPIGINSTFSNRYNTTCSTKFGDCGCDACEGKYTDISKRLDAYRKYQRQIGRKAFWGVPQAFGGSEYWSRAPNAAEEVVMSMMFINHGARGIVAWNYPTSPELTEVTSNLAKALSSKEVSDFLLSGPMERLALSSNFDAAAWRIGNQILFSIVHLADTRYKRDLKIALGVNVVAMKSLWPPRSQNWFFGNQSITRPGIGPSEVNLFLVQTQ